MTDNQNAEESAHSESAETTLAPENLSGLEAVARRIRQQEQQQEQEQQPLEEAEEETESTLADALTEDEEPEEASDEVAESDELDGLDLTEEEKEFITANPQSRLAKRIPQLVKQRKEAEEKAAQVEARLQELANAEKNPFEDDAAKAEDNPFREVETVDQLKEKYAETSAFVRWADDLLEDNDDALADDVIHTEDGKDYTKKEVRKALRDARKNKETFLPARYQELQQVEAQKAQKESLDRTAREELPWMEDAESEGAKVFSSIVNNPKFDEIRAMDPTIDYLLAHAVNSRYVVGKQQQKEAKTAPDLTPKQKPPKTPQGVTLGQKTPSASVKAQLEKLQRSYNETGDHQALVQLRAFQHTHNL